MRRSHQVTILPSALDDLRKIHDYIARDSRVNARRFIRELRRKILAMSRFPRRCAPCQIVAQGEFHDLRVLSHRGYAVFYDVGERNVLVLHVAGPGQDWAAFFA